MSEMRECVVRVCDAQGVEHRVKVRAGSVYEAALLGLERLQRSDWSRSGVLDDGLVRSKYGRSRQSIASR
jgi:hypothetical protein